jgi:GNAT superfamily N-acetyltransferase
MFWRQSSADYNRLRGSSNRRAFRRLVASRTPPGVIAYVGEEPAGWCAIAPRAVYGRLERSRVLAPADEAPVWSIVCFFVARPHRRRGLTRRLIEGAVAFAASRGATIVEGYPIDPRQGKGTADVFAYTGIASAFRAAGFSEVIRRSPTRPIMRRTTGRSRS